MIKDFDSAYIDFTLERDYPTPAPEQSMDGVQLAMGGSGAGKYKTDKTMTDAGMGMMDMGAATAKGMTQGFVGLPGDLEGIGRMVINMMGGDVNDQTTLPTTEEVKDWLDKNVGKVGDGKNPYETIGEFLAPGGYVKGVKSVRKAKRAAAGAAAASPASVDGEENK
jgi:hypothetical protein